ncbi:MAG TPA: hypothetical protein VHB48_01585 [Chitinophagaceae bacterium]|jgi:hypothetical protein|nr:hypothetical protein [Chitinophagaceae bacterium]
MKIIYRRLGREKAWGQAHCGENTIEIDPTLRGRHKLEIIIHEAMHIQNPAWEEEQVIQKSRQMANILWKERYRQIQQ